MWADDVADADLRAAVAASVSWRGVLRHFDETSPRAGRRLRERCDLIGISYQHFRGAGGRSADAKRLAAVIASATSWPEVMRELGYSAESGSARTLRKHARVLRLDTGHLDRPASAAAAGADGGGAFAGAGGPRELRRAATLLVAAHCALLGHEVSWPLEPKPYDLIVDTAQEGLLRVQVKSGTRVTNGSWIVWITRSAQGRRVSYSAEEIDYFGIVTGDRAVSCCRWTSSRDSPHSVSAPISDTCFRPEPSDLGRLTAR